MTRFTIKLNAVALTVFWLALAAPVALWAQRTLGSINGLVKDPTGALVPGATVTVTDPNKGVFFTDRVGSDGAYLVPDLLPGSYNITVEAAGFKLLTVEGLNLDVGTTLTQDLNLEVGTATQKVTVSGTASLVETTTNMEGTTIDQAHMLQLPLANREIFLLLNLTPGVFFTRAGGDNPAFNYLSGATGGGTGIGGGIMAMFDGAPNGTASSNFEYSSSNAGVEVQPPPDALQEFRVQSSNLSAEYGQASTIVVNAVTKSGTNQFHGDVYEFLRNDLFDAALWNTPSKAELRQNVAGGTIGGPVRKNKTFFFFAYERFWSNLGTFGTSSVGLPNWRMGDFSNATRDANGTAVLVPIYDPATGGTTQISCNGVMNVICPNRINAVAAKALSYIPQANHTPIDIYNNTGNFWATPVATTGRPFYLGRVDQELAKNTKLYLRYFDSPMTAYRWGGGTGSPQYGPASQAQLTVRNNLGYALGLTHLFSPTFFVNFTAGLQRVRSFTGTPAVGLYPNDNWPEELGLASVLPAKQFPGLNFGGGTIDVDSIGSNLNITTFRTNTNEAASFTKVMGVHTFKFGGEYQRFNSNNVSNGGAGNYGFNGVFTQKVGANGLGVANTGINLADFLLGDNSSVSGMSNYDMPYRAGLYSGYYQDDWRVTPNLTLNLGLRYETATPVWSPTNELQGFNPFVPDPGAGTGSIPVGAMGIVTFENLNGQGKYLWNWDKMGLLPRFGFAYRVFGRSDTVVRGGFGIFWANSTAYGVLVSSGFSGAYSQTYSVAAPPPQPVGPTTLTLTDLAVPPVSARTPTFGNVGTQYATSSLSFLYPNRAIPYTMQPNFTLQHQWKGMFFEAGYLASLTRHLSDDIGVNMIPPNLLGAAAVANPRLFRPYTQFSGPNAQLTSYNDTNSNGDYHALNLKTERRFSNGFSWIATFVWSKWIDQDTYGGGTWENIYNRAAEMSLSGNDVPWRLVFSPIMDLPFGTGRHWLNQGGAVNAVVGGWQLATMGTYQAGFPLTAAVLGGGSTILGDSLQTDRPNVVPGCNPKSPNQWQSAAGVLGIQYLNPACFTAPPAFTYGNASRELPNARGPGMEQLNLMLSKDFQIRERYRLEFRAEAVDLFNTPQFSNPASTVNGSNFGIITATDNTTRRTIDFDLKIYF